MGFVESSISSIFLKIKAVSQSGKQNA